jgi:hypothetical protein
MMKSNFPSLCVTTAATLAAGVILLGIFLGPASAATVQPPIVLGTDELPSAVVVRDVHMEDGVVSGVAINNTGNQLKDVDLLIRYDWLWTNEFAPGPDSPGRAIVHTLEDIPPGGEVPFTYFPESPLPDRSDGRFQTSVVVVGYTQFR